MKHTRRLNQTNSRNRKKEKKLNYIDTTGWNSKTKKKDEVFDESIWQGHFAKDELLSELLGHYEPIKELGTLST